MGKRALPRAADRNRAKRRVRETFRVLRPELPPLDIVVIVTRAPESGWRDELTLGFRELARRAESESAQQHSGQTTEQKTD